MSRLVLDLVIKVIAFGLIAWGSLELGPKWSYDNFFKEYVIETIREEIGKR